MQIMIIMFMLGKMTDRIDERKKALKRLKGQRWALEPFSGTGKEASFVIKAMTDNLSTEEKKGCNLILLTVFSDHVGKVKLQSISENHADSEETQNFVVAFLSDETLEKIHYGESCFHAVYTNVPICYIGDSSDLDEVVNTLKNSERTSPVCKDFVEIHMVGTGKDAYLSMTISYEKGMDMITTTKENWNLADKETVKKLITMPIGRVTDQGSKGKDIDLSTQNEPKLKKAKQDQRK